MTTPNKNRRDFLKKSAVGAIAVPYIFSPHSILAKESRSFNDRPTIGIIGAGGMASGNINSAKDWLDVVAIADADAGRGAGFNKRFAAGKADVYADYRKVLERKDVDLIHVATPDHWHTKPVVEAMLAGKDIYCEKPLTLTVDEGKLIRKVQKETGRIVQVGTQQRSTFNLFVKAMAIVLEGRLGKIKKLEVSIGGAPKSPEIPVAEVPKDLDWDRWLGPAPTTDYRFLKKEKGRPNTNCHYEFRWWYEYSGGKLTDWGAHHVDIATWALRLNGQSTGPESISGSALHPVKFENGIATHKDRYNTATAFKFIAKFPGDVEMIIQNQGNGILIEGEKGRIYVNRGKLEGKPVDELRDNPLKEDSIAKVYKNLPMEHNERKAHWANFLSCVKSRKEPISDVHTHMEMLNLCHLSGIAARLGRGFKWDATKEEIVGDEQANAMLSRPYRKGYEIEM